MLRWRGGISYGRVCGLIACTSFFLFCLALLLSVACVQLWACIISASPLF